jgi:hypothetical protein
MIRALPALVLTVTALLAGSALADDGPDSGVKGQVRIAPTCGAQRQGEECSRGYETTVRIVRLPEREFVKRIHTGEHGRFRTELQPGRYRLRPRGGKNGFPYCGPQDVTVKPGRFTKVRLVCDTGIR